MRSNTYRKVAEADGPMVCQRCGDENQDSLFSIRIEDNRTRDICIGCLYVEAKQRKPGKGDIRLAQIIEWDCPLEAPLPVAVPDNLETRVWELIAYRWPNKQIERYLKLAPSVVREFVAELKRKNGVSGPLARRRLIQAWHKKEARV